MQETQDLSLLTWMAPYWSWKVRGEHWHPRLTYGLAALVCSTFSGELLAAATIIRERIILDILECWLIGVVEESWELTAGLQSSLPIYSRWSLLL